MEENELSEPSPSLKWLISKFLVIFSVELLFIAPVVVNAALYVVRCAIWIYSIRYIPSDWSFITKWIKIHGQHCLLAESSDAEISMTCESLIAGSPRYSHVWEKHFANKALSFGIGRDHIESFFGVLTISRPYQQ